MRGLRPARGQPQPYLDARRRRAFVLERTDQTPANSHKRSTVHGSGFAARTASSACAEQEQAPRRAFPPPCVQGRHSGCQRRSGQPCSQGGRLHGPASAWSTKGVTDAPATAGARTCRGKSRIQAGCACCSRARHDACPPTGGACARQGERIWRTTTAARYSAAHKRVFPAGRRSGGAPVSRSRSGLVGDSFLDGVSAAVYETFSCCPLLPAGRWHCPVLRARRFFPSEAPFAEWPKRSRACLPPLSFLRHVGIFFARSSR